MPPVEGELQRLKNLLSSGKSLTESAKIMDISRSKAQRLKKKIIESSGSSNNVVLRWGQLENAPTLRVDSLTINELIDWSRTIFYNKENIFQKMDDHWVRFPLGIYLERHHGFKPEISESIILHDLRRVLNLQKIGINAGYRDVVQSFDRLCVNWYTEIEEVLRRNWLGTSYHGDLSERHLTSFTPSPSLIVDSVIQRSELLELDVGFILHVMVSQINPGRKKEQFIEAIEQKNVVLPNFAEVLLSKMEDDEVFPDPEFLVRDKYQASETTTHTHFTMHQILTEYSNLPPEIIDFMIEHENFDSEDVELMKFGGISDIDLEFAKKGGFKTASQLELARDMRCTSLEELDIVIDNEWESGDEMRNAIDMYGVGPDNRQQYLNMVVMNPQVNWTGEWKMELLDWADMADQDDFARLQGFPHPKGMKFFEDILMQLEEPSVRTDYLMRDYNEIDAPGDFISDESDFADLMSSKPFVSLLKVGKGGVTQVDFDQRDLQKETWAPKPKIDASEYPQFSRSRKKAARELQAHLRENVLDKSLTGAYDWLVSNLKTKLGIGKKDEFLPIDELRDMLGLDKTAVNSLHEARLARNFVAHPFEAEEKEPTWLMVALCLECAESVLNHEH